MRNPHAAGAGASNRSDSRDEVSTRKAVPTQPCHEVDTWAPWSTAGERAQRLRLYKSRDICGARAARTEGWTHHVFKAAEELAGDYVWRRSTEAELRCVADAVVRMIQSGVELEQGGIHDA